MSSDSAGPPPFPPPGPGAWGEPTPPGGWPPPPPADPWGARLGQQYVPVPPPVGNDGFSVAALVLGIVPVMGGLLGIVFGFVARGRIKRSGQGGKGMATAGIICGSVWLVLLIGLAALGFALEADRDSDGTLTGAGSVSSFDLALGDCITELPEGQVRDVKAVPCDTSHLGEVFETFDLPGGSYPGEEKVTAVSDERCLAAIPGFLGIAASVDDGYGFYYLYPQRRSWGLGDRTVTCVLAHPDEELLTGSLRGTGPFAPTTSS